MSEAPPSTCIYCDTELTDTDMAERDLPDGTVHRYETGRCPNGDCEASLPCATE